MLCLISAWNKQYYYMIQGANIIRTQAQLMQCALKCTDLFNWDKYISTEHHRQDTDIKTLKV